MNPIFSAGLNILGGAIGGIIQKGENRAARKWAAKEQRWAEIRQENRDIKSEDRANLRQLAGERRADRRTKQSERREWNRQLKFTDPAFIRERAEAAGFNPLLFTGQSQYSPVGGGASGYGGYTTSGGAGQATAATPSYGPAVGDLIAGGFASFDEANYRNELLAVEKSRLEMQAGQLEEIAQNAKFQPTYGGLYDGKQTPLLARLSAGPNKDVIAAASAALAKEYPGADPGPYPTSEVRVTPEGNPALGPANEGQPADFDETAMWWLQNEWADARANGTGWIFGETANVLNETVEGNFSPNAPWFSWETPAWLKKMQAMWDRAAPPMDAPGLHPDDNPYN